MKYILLCTLWITWCFLHSLFTSTGTTGWFKEKLGNKFVYYRICYNMLSLVTLIPMLYWQGSIPGPVIIPLSPILKAVKLITIISAVIIIAGSFLSFNAMEFIGINRITDKKVKPLILKKGFYAVVRHPMYLAGFIFFAAMMTDASLARFLGYLILAAYMVIGTIREDRRLAQELGEQYKDYQESVPLIIPNFKK